MVKNLPAMQTWVQSLGREDPPEEGVATLSSIFGWRIPMNRGAWQATVHGVTKSRTQLSMQLMTLSVPSVSASVLKYQLINIDSGFILYLAHFSTS